MFLKSIFLLCSLISIPAASSAEIVEFPDDAFWRSIGRSLNEGKPDFEVLAKRSARYREANEFSRAAVLEEEISRLTAEYEAFGPDLQVRLRANIRLGDYDASRGGFPISLFTPGTYLQVGAGLQFANAGDYAVLPMGIEEAKVLRDREGRGGQTSGLLLLGDFGKAPGANGELIANVYSFEYVDESGNVLASLAREPARSQLDDAARTELLRTTQQRILALAGLPPLGSDWDAVRTALVENYSYAVSHAQAYNDAKIEIRDGKIVSEDLSAAKRLRVGFGNDLQLVSRMFSRQSPVARAKIPQGQIDTGLTGRGLDCDTQGVLDACGVLIFEKNGDRWVLVAAEGVIELDETDYTAAFETVIGEDIAEFLRSDLRVAFASNWVAGRPDDYADGGYAMSARYLLGESLEATPYYLRPMDPWPGLLARHEVVTYAVDGARDRTPLIFILAPKDVVGSEVSAAKPLPVGDPISIEDLVEINAYSIFEETRFLPAIKAALGGVEVGNVQYPASMKPSPFQDAGEWFVSGGCRPYVCERQYTNVLVRKSDGAIGIIYNKDGALAVYGAKPEELTPVLTWNFGATR